MNNIKIEYPKYTKEQDQRCKLTESDIEKIQQMKRNGSKNAEIADIFNVSKELIRYWTNPNTRKKVKDYQTERRKKFPPSKEEKAKTRAKYLEKKKEMDEFRDFLRLDKRVRYKKWMDGKVRVIITQEEIDKIKSGILPESFIKKLS